MFRLRLDQNKSIDNETLSKIVQECVSSFTELIIVHHVLPHGNPHVHAYAKVDMKEPALRQRIKRIGFTASEFSLKKCDESRKDEYIQYLFNQKHGNVATILYTHNIDSEYLDRLQAQAKEYHDEYKRNSNSKRDSKPTISDLANETYEGYKNIYIRETVNDLTRLYPSAPEGVFMYREYLKIAIQVCNKHNQPFEENYLRRLVTTAMCKTDSGKQLIITKMLQKEFPDNYT